MRSTRAHGKPALHKEDTCKQLKSSMTSTSLAAVLHGMLHLVRDIRLSGKQPQFDVLRDGRSAQTDLHTLGVALRPEGKRKGFELEWLAMISGEAALVTAVHSSLTANLGRHLLPAQRQQKPMQPFPHRGGQPRCHEAVARRSLHSLELPANSDRDP